MVYKDLTFLLFAKDMSASRGFEKVALSADGMAKGVSGSLGMAGVAVAGLAIAVTAKSVKMAADFQQATTRLVTDAGESSKTIGKLSDGLLNISVDTGTGAQEIAQGMYKVSSAGYTMANGGLKVMKAAAEGAKVGGADLTTVADALTTVMRDYGIAASKSNNTTSELIATVSRGKTTMEDLAGSLHSVLPNAQALGISLNDVLGALATMTQEGISADQATQNLNHTIVSLANPTHVQAQEMAAMGLNATTVSKELGKRGLTGTLNEMVDAITKHMGPAGLVLQKSFTNSALAAQSAKTELAALGPQAKTLATAYQNGSISLATWNKAVKGLPADQANLAKQWAATENASKGFSTALKSGSGDAQTFTAALSKMAGGQTGLQVALHITGIHADDTAASVKAIGDAADGAQKHVSDWTTTQKTYNQQQAQFQANLDKLQITLGGALLPAMTQFTDHLNIGAHQWGDIFAATGDWFGGLVKNFQRGGGQIAGAFKNVTGAMKGSEDSLKNWGKGSRGWLYGTGQNVTDGFAAGINSHRQAVIDAVKNTAGIAPQVARNALRVQSPSRVFHEIGVYVGQGLSNGILGSVDQVKSASSKLAAAVVSDFKSGAIGKGAEDAALGTIGRMSAKLQALSTRRATALANVASLKTDRANEVGSVRQSNIDAGNVTSFAAPGDAIGGLQSLVANTRRFKTDLQKLAKMGIDRTTFDQLVNAGVAGGGLTAADALIGNPIDFKEIVSLQKQLGSASGSLANYAGNFDYGKQIALQGGRAKAYGWEMQKVAASGMRTLGRETHININISGHYAGTKDDLAKSLTQVFRDAVRRGVIPKGALANL